MRKPTRAQWKRFEELKKTDPTLEVSWSESGGVARLRGNLSVTGGEDPVSVSRAFLVSNKALFGFADPLRETVLVNVGSDRMGNHQVRFQQVVGGVPVFGHQLVVHVNANGILTETNGGFHPGLKVPTTPKVKPDVAVALAEKHEEGNRQWMEKSPVLTVLVLDDIVYLCWQVTMEGTGKDIRGAVVPAKWEYFIDAETGKVIWRYINLR